MAAFDLGLLAQKGSLFVTRPTLWAYAAQREDLEAMASELFDVVKSGKVKIEVNQTYALKNAAQAHRDLEARETTGRRYCCLDSLDAESQLGSLFADGDLVKEHSMTAYVSNDVQVNDPVLLHTPNLFNTALASKRTDGPALLDQRLFPAVA